MFLLFYAFFLSNKEFILKTEVILSITLASKVGRPAIFPLPVTEIEETAIRPPHIASRQKYSDKSRDLKGPAAKAEAVPATNCSSILQNTLTESKKH